MIEISKAWQIIDRVDHTPIVHRLSLKEASGLILAEDVVSPISMPPFSQSAMDGYAIAGDEAIQSYAIVGEVAAGDDPTALKLLKGEAVRIFTGAQIPENANTVVQQEFAELVNGSVSFTISLGIGSNIREQGEQIKYGEVAATAGTKVTPGLVGFLAGLGITEVVAYKKPKVAIVVSGNELIPPGQPLTDGKIYESNSFMIEAAVKEKGYEVVRIDMVQDTYDNTVELLSDVIKEADVVLVTGGISVGDYDFVGKALTEIGVDQLFYKVKQKPGKPLYFGKKDDAYVFGLPGNPAAALSCFYMYALRLMDKISGSNDPGLMKLQLPITHYHSKKGDRGQFLKAVVRNDGVEVLNYQSSAMLRAYENCNAFLYIPSDISELKSGDLVEVFIL